MNNKFESWGRNPKAIHTIERFEWISDNPFPRLSKEVYPDRNFLAFGQGRSYGDSCLNDGGVLMPTCGLDRFIHFDASSGTLKCEAGVTLMSLLDFCVPRGWFLPVTPGTRHVSIGGAIANDVHGKNHHRAGTFGCHVESFLLLRSDGSRTVCSRRSNPGLFAATIGGLGLTGIILWVELKLRPIETPYVAMESVKFGNLDEFFEISAQSDRDFEYTVAWMDCLASGKNFGRGIFLRGNHCMLSELPPVLAAKLKRKKLVANKEMATVPFDFPEWSLNRMSIQAFNFAYYNKQVAREKRSLVRYEPFFYPLDIVHDWNRIYGPRGLFQFQCVIPKSGSRDATKQLMKVVVDSGVASFLSVAKEFGEVESPGLLSFPRAGVTLNLDLPNCGQKTQKVLATLEAIVVDNKGAMYPAKDACMSKNSFELFYPKLGEFSKFRDPRFSSSFARRVGLM